MMKTINHKIFGKNIKLFLRNDGDRAVANEVFVNREYRLCEDAIRQAKDPIIDIGGHLGFFSILASVLNPNVPVYTFEPYMGSYELLMANLKENKIRNVYPKQLAVSDSIGEAELFISKEDLNHSLTEPIEPTGETQKIQITTLEKIFRKNRIDKCSLLKMDCEGSEYDIIYNTPKEILERTECIILEYHARSRLGGRDDMLDGLTEHLKKSGFKVQIFPNAKMKELGVLFAY